jgi:bifunctional oligoribonuclease and PAP phosphatase NrnA
VVVDVGERERIPRHLPKVTEDATILVIDHHKNHGDLGDIVWRRPASSVGEMVVELARHLDWTVSAAFAECAYTAILTDTGSFHYSSTSESCMEAASFLLGKGVQPWKVASNVYESWPANRVQLLGDVLGTLRVAWDGRYASLAVTPEMLAFRGATVDMTEGFVNQGRRIAGVEISALFRELEPGRYRVSFRSRGRVDVATIASLLGGGGHRNASGGTVDGSLDEVREKVSALVKDALDTVDPDDSDYWSRH